MRKIMVALVGIAGLSAVPVFAHCGSCGAGETHAHSHGSKKGAGDIVAVASSAGSFDTLVTAVKAAGLVETLQSDGPFTVFAPTDEAFAKLPAGTLEGLLADPDKLRKILLYHVVASKVTSQDVVGLSKAKTAEGSNVKIKVKGGDVMINEARVVKTDIPASNGIIHVIDTVILPGA